MIVYSSFQYLQGQRWGVGEMTFVSMILPFLVKKISLIFILELIASEVLMQHLRITVP